jgi:adenosine deaminase
VRRAADDGAIYLEVLVSIARGVVVDIIKDAGAFDPEDLAGYERKLHADPRWSPVIAAAHDSVTRRERQARELLRCGTPEAARGCAVTVRYLGQIGRTAPAAQVFAELLVAFEVGVMEPRIVGVNLVSPEDNPTALADYDLQMALVAAVAGEFRGRTAMHVTLHAGELTAAIAPADSLVFHIRHAVEIAHAERIGHGVDVMSERDAPALLAEMRERGVAVEVCLTSNAVILDVAGAAHPLAEYLRAGVPVALATDDAGVSRSSLTGELVRAVAVQGLSYPQIKALVRNSLSVAFVPGASLWTAAGPPHRVADCAGEVAASPEPRPGPCAAFLAASERARLQWKLETQLAAFEAE